jgi:hypothetical protein
MAVWSLLLQNGSRLLQGSPPLFGVASRFYIHLVVFMVNATLLVVNWLTTPGIWWAIRPLLGCGAGILAHGLAEQLKDRM